MVLHYGQEIFEGLKAYRRNDGSIACFRPEANAARFRGSSARLAMAELPEELFLASIEELVSADREWVPAAGGEGSLYLRPFMLATEVGLGVRPSAEYLYVLIASPAGPYFAGGVKPIDVWLATDYTRASLGGTGTAKCGGNYAASLLPQAQGAAHGCAQVAYLDAEERTWIEEMGSNNLFFVYGAGEQVEIVTPVLSGSILAGITRDSLLLLAKEIGCQVTEGRGVGCGVALRRGRREHHRGLRLRHGRGDHADRAGQAQRRRGRRRWRGAGPGDAEDPRGAAGHPDRQGSRPAPLAAQDRLESAVRCPLNNDPLSS